MNCSILCVIPLILFIITTAVSAESCADTGDTTYCTELRDSLTNCVNIGCLTTTEPVCDGVPDTQTCYTYAREAQLDNRIDYTVWMRLCCAMYYPQCNGNSVDGSPVIALCYDSCVNGYLEVGGYTEATAEYWCKTQMGLGHVSNTTAPTCREVESFASDSYCEGSISSLSWASPLSSSSSSSSSNPYNEYSGSNSGGDSSNGGDDSYSVVNDGGYAATIISAWNIGFIILTMLMLV